MYVDFGDRLRIVIAINGLFIAGVVALYETESFITREEDFRFYLSIAFVVLTLISSLITQLFILSDEEGEYSLKALSLIALVTSCSALLSLAHYESKAQKVIYVVGWVLAILTWLYTEHLRDKRDEALERAEKEKLLWEGSDDTEEDMS